MLLQYFLYPVHYNCKMRTKAEKSNNFWIFIIRALFWIFLLFLIYRIEIIVKGCRQNQSYLELFFLVILVIFQIYIHHNFQNFLISLDFTVEIIRET